MTERIGERLGNYHLLQLLGQGGFTDVYLGEHIHLKNLAAIKVLYTRLASDLRTSGEVWVDDTLFLENGKILI
jgi:serine/threonine protein kinase